MHDIAPIETKYKGYRFRSRLEARWAVFFDQLGIGYEYELEGYTLPSGAKYLPDFYLPELELHVEIKPSSTIPYRDISRVLEFATDGDKPLLLIVGTPTQEAMYLVDRRHDPMLAEIEADFDGKGQEPEIVAAVFDTLNDWCSVCFGASPTALGWTLVYRTIPPNEQHALSEALLKGKQARFEFGENGG